jgi:hypothetical protein
MLLDSRQPTAMAFCQGTAATTLSVRAHVQTVALRIMAGGRSLIQHTWVGCLQMGPVCSCGPTPPRVEYGNGPLWQRKFFLQASVCLARELDPLPACCVPG